MRQDARGAILREAMAVRAPRSARGLNDRLALLFRWRPLFCPRKRKVPGRVCTESVIAAHFHGHEVGPAFLGASFVNRHLYILLDVGEHDEKTEVEPDWTRFPESCVGLEGDGNA